MLGKKDFPIQDVPENVNIIIKKLKKKDAARYLLFKEEIKIGIYLFLPKSTKLLASLF